MSPSNIVFAWLGVMIGAATVAYLIRPDPALVDCARDNNVYACEYVAQPVKSPLLPPPQEGE